MRRRPVLKEYLKRLEVFYGRPKRPPVTDPYLMTLWENCAYLVTDERRARVYQALERDVGTTPEAILAAPKERLAAVIKRGGMRPPMRADKLRCCADIALEVGLPRLRRLVRTAPQEARTILKRFPGIADPGADKILLMNGALATLAPDSNVLRVLRRLGYGKERKYYPQTYRSVVEAVAPELPHDSARLVRAHQLLRQHGKELCKESAPRCEACPLAADCPWYGARA